MNAFTIKMIAITTMVIDHLGVFVFPEQISFRMIGRLSFPLFAWLISNGAKHTKNMNNYLVRLFVFGVLSQIPYILAFRQIHPRIDSLNIFFTLFLGLLAIKFWKKAKNNVVKIAAIVCISVLGQLLGVEYGAVGILSIVFFYIFDGNIKLTILSQSFVYFVLWFALLLVNGKSISYYSILQPAALLSLPIIFQYNHKAGLKLRYLFYLFYPLHLLGFYLFV